MRQDNGRVEKLLNEKSFTRSNDKLLFIEYIKEYSEVYKNANEEVKQTIIEVILEMPKESSLTRARAYYQNKKGMYLPWIWTMNKRKQAQEKCRQEYWNTKGLFDWLARWFKKF